MATRGTIPAKRGGARAAKKKDAAKQAPKRVILKSRAAGYSTLAATPPKQVVDNLVQYALHHAHGSSQPSYVIPVGEGGILYVAFGSAAGIREQLERVSPAPKRRLVRDSATGLFVRARDALRRPKTTTRETR